MRLDESFNMRYTVLQNTLLVTILKRFTEMHIPSKQGLGEAVDCQSQRPRLSSLSWEIRSGELGEINGFMFFFLKPSTTEFS